MKELVKNRNKPSKCSCAKRKRLVQEGGNLIKIFTPLINSKLKTTKNE